MENSKTTALEKIRSGLLEDSITVEQEGVMIELNQSTTGKFSFRVKVYRPDLKQAQNEVIEAQRWFANMFMGEVQ